MNRSAALFSILLVLFLALPCGVFAADPGPSDAAPGTGAAKPAETTAAKPAADQPQGDPMQIIDAYIREKTSEGAIDKSGSAWRQHLPKFPAVEFPKGARYFWNLKTSLGDIKVRLMPEIAPNHVANFLYLTELGFFDGLDFHRVIPEFMAQGGCPMGNGRGSPGYRFDGEFDPKVRHDRPGLLSMANAGPGTDGSQFFLTFVPCPWLDGKHTIFGEVVSGEETLQAIEKRGSRSGRPTQKILIEKATITTE